MSREIKFRCWNAHGSSMHPWSELVERNKIHLLANQQESYPVMQYTGLKDVNGVEIYDGDILQNVEEWYIGEVERLPSGEWCFDGESIEEWIHICQVIGNIHQNPELLEQTGQTDTLEPIPDKD